jgi:hypothetical protein
MLSSHLRVDIKCLHTERSGHGHIVIATSIMVSWSKSVEFKMHLILCGGLIPILCILIGAQFFWTEECRHKVPSHQKGVAMAILWSTHPSRPHGPHVSSSRCTSRFVVGWWPPPGMEILKIWVLAQLRSPRPFIRGMAPTHLGALLDTNLRFRKHPKPVTISILCATEWSSSFLLCWVGQ